MGKTAVHYSTVWWHDCQLDNPRFVKLLAKARDPSVIKKWCHYNALARMRKGKDPVRKPAEFPTIKIDPPIPDDLYILL